jgi:hypothetical protein
MLSFDESRPDTRITWAFLGAIASPPPLEGGCCEGWSDSAGAGHTRPSSSAKFCSPTAAFTVECQREVRATDLDFGDQLLGAEAAYTTRGEVVCAAAHG